MKELGVGLLVLFAVLLVSFGIVWIAQGNDFFMYKFFAPKYENARREVFENTQSYVEGKRQDLSRYHYEYVKCKTAADSEAIRQVVVQQFANFDEHKIEDPTLRSWLYQVRRGSD